MNTQTMTGIEGARGRVLPDQRRMGPMPRAPERRAICQAVLPDAGLCRLAIVLAAHWLGAEVEAIARPGRAGERICEARHIAFYLAHVVFQVSLTEAGNAFDMDRTSVAYGVRRIEEKRDMTEYDLMIDRLEHLAFSIVDSLRGPGWVQLRANGQGMGR